jgi:hypothetical protein
MNISDKMGIELEMADYMNELFQSLPSEDEKPGVNQYKKGVLDSYEMVIKIINKEIKN